MISRGLIIRAPWIDLILSGRKTWEMRSQRTNVRGPIALIRQGGNLVVGTATLVESREPLSRDEYMLYHDQHAIPIGQLDQVFGRGWVYPWVLTDIRPLSPAIPFISKSGPVKFVILDSVACEKIARQVAPVAARSDDVVPGLPHTPLLPVSSGPIVAEPASTLVASAPSNTPVFTFRPERAQAYGRSEADGSFTVLAGSTAMRRGSPNVKRDSDDRDVLVRSGVLVPDADVGLYRFSRNHRFSSASKAAGIVKDGNASGPTLWKDEKTGRTLKDHIAGR